MEKSRSYPRRMWLLILGLFFSLNVFAQSGIEQAEYFFDQDPGIGLATPIPLTPGLDTLEVNGLNIPLTGLSAGYHWLQIRVRDAQQGWGLGYQALIYINPLLSPILPPLPPFTLSEAEYFFNSDPGPGNGISLPFIAGDSAEVLRTLQLEGLAAGTHRVGVRFRELSGAWSLPLWASFTVTDTVGLQVPQADFAWDTAAALAGQSVAFTNESQTVNANTTYEWDIDADGSVDYTTANINHAFAGPGLYDVLLRVTNAEGTIDTTALKALYRFYGGSLASNAGQLGTLTAVGSSRFVTDRTGLPNSAYNTDTASVISYLRASGVAVSVDGFTLSYWFKGQLQNNAVFMRSSYGNLQSGLNGRHYVGNQDVMVDPIGGAAVNNNQWHHLVVTYVPGHPNGLKSYFNGQFVGSNGTAGASPGTIDSLVIGALGNGQTRGTFDDVYLFGRALDSNEVTQLYNEAITATMVKQVLVGPVPSNALQASGPITFCSGDSVVLTAPAGSNHLWNTGAFGSSITVKTTGNYSCAYTDINGLGRTSEVVPVLVNPTPVVTYQLRPATNGLANGSIVLQVQGGSAFRYNYLWNTGDTTAMLSGLTAGNYSVTIDDGACPQAFQFQINDSIVQPLQGIVAAEAYFDVDPGAGNGIALPVQQGRLSSGVANVSTAGLSIGFHRLGVRFLDHLGNWSIASHYLISVVPPADTANLEPRGNLVAAEYFFNQDPGIGLANPIAIGAATDELDLPVAIPVGGLPVGFNQLAVRVQDEWGRWSIISEKTFFVDVPAPPGGPNFAIPMVAAEYFIGTTDPGVGNATPINIPVSDSFQVLRAVAIDSLSVGQHRLHLRTRDVMGLWSTTRTVAFNVVESACVPATPDFGPLQATAGVPVNFLSSSTQLSPGASFGWDIDADGSIDYTGASATHSFAQAGVYDVRLVINAGDSCEVAVVKQVQVGPLTAPLITASGPLTLCAGETVTLQGPAGSNYIWSNAATTQNLVVDRSGLYSLTYTDASGQRLVTNSLQVAVNPQMQVQLQVFNANNGLNNGSAGLSVRGGSSFVYQYLWSTGDTSPSITGLAAGSYQVTVTDGFCPQQFSFQIIDTLLQPLQGIVAAEFFFDSDPGAGQGTPLPFAQGNPAQGFVNVSAAGLSVGPHDLNIRVRDELGQWSIALRRRISVHDTLPPFVATPPADLVALEYFYDEDPGPGQGTPVPGVVPSQLLQMPIQASTAGLQPGVHQLFIRAKDAAGQWSLAARSQVFIDIPLPPSLPDYRVPMVYAEYFIGTQDPGPGLATAIPVPVDTSWQLQRSIDVSALLPGSYVLNLRTRDLFGNWSAIRQHPFAVAPATCLVPQPAFSYPLVNAGQTANFINLSNNLQASSSFAWDFNADGVVDDTTFSPAYSFASPGTYDVLLRVNNGANCVASVVQQVVVGPVLSQLIALDGPATFCEPEVRVLTAPAGSNYLWSNGANTQSITVAQSGRYEVSYLDVQGNRVMAPAVQIRVNPAMQLQLFVNNETNGLQNGSAGLYAQGGSAFRYQYLWSTGDSTASVSGLSAGQYYVQVSDGVCPQTLFFTLIDSVVPAPVGLVAAEYFFNNDPGVGAGTPILISQGRQGGGFAGVSLAGLSPGLHLLGMRVLENTGLWSHVKTYQIFISEDDNFVPEPIGLLASAEYFIDADPGPYQGIPLAVPSGVSLYDLPLNIPVGNISPGNHTLSIRVFDTNGKWSIAGTAEFNNCNPPAKPVAVPDLVLCTGDSIRLGIVQRDSGNVVWTGPNGFLSNDTAPVIPVAALANSGYYLLRIEGEPGCFSVPDTVFVQVDTIPANPGAILGASTVCLGSNIANFTIPPVLTARNYTWHLPAGAVILAGNNTNSVAIDLSNWTDTVGSISVTASNGCGSVTSSPIVIRRDSSNVAVSIVALGDTSVCSGSTVLLETSAIPAGYNVQWWRNGQVLAGATGSQLVATVSGNYQAELLNAVGCGQLSNTIAVSINPLPVALVSVSGASSICGSGTVQLTAQAVGGATYQWLRDGLPVAGASTRVYQAASAGSYQLVVTTAAGCSDTSAAIPLSIYPIPVASITPAGPTTFCEGGSVLLQADTGAGLTYQWLKNGLALAGANQSTLLADAAGQYRVLVTNAGSCFDTSAAVQIQVQPVPVALVSLLGADSICAGSSVMLEAGFVSGATYQWLFDGQVVPQASSRQFSAAVAGDYQVVVQSAFGCADTSAAVSVHVKALPDVSVQANGPVDFCVGGSVNLAGNDLPGQAYQWLKDGQVLTGESSAQLLVQSTGQYQLVVTAVNGCVDTSMAVPVNVNPLPDATLNVGGNQFICAGGSLVLEVPALAGNSYQWLLNGQLLSGAQAASLVAQQSGTYRVVVTRAATGCEDTSEAVSLGVYPQPQAGLTASGATSFCAGGSVDLVATPASGVTYTWLKDGAVLTGAASGNFTAASSGAYRVIVTNSDGCSDTSAAVSVTVLPQPQAGLTASGATSFCVGGSVDLVATPATGVNYAWLKDGAVLTGATSGSFVAASSGAYRVVVTNSDGCSDTSAAVSVTVLPQPQAGLTASGATSFCAGGSVDLVATPATGVSYVWLQDGAVLSGATSGNFVAASSGAYRVVVTNSDGCSDTSAAVSVTVLPQPQVDLTASGATSFCAGGSVDLVASPATGVTYTWLKDGAVLSGATSGNFVAASSGAYRVVVTNSDGCSDTSAAVSVTVLPQPQAGLTASGATSFCAGGSVDLVASPATGVTYVWLKDGAVLSGVTQSSYTANQSGSYQVIVTSPEGCSDTSNQITVTVQVCGYIAGSVNYLNQANTPMTNTQVTLLNQQQQTIGQTTTNANGGFSFNNTGNGQFQLQLSTNKPWGGANATDALAAARHFTGLNLQTGLRLKAADVNASNNVNATDALQIGRRFTGQLGSFTAGDWAFDEPSIVVNNDSIQLQLGALAYGDINGSYLPDVQLRLGNEILLAQQGFAEMQQQRWPIQTVQALETGAISLVLTLPAGIDVHGVQLPASNTAAEFSQQGQELRISWFSLEPISLQSGETLLEMQFTGTTHHAEAELRLAPGCELADGWAQPLQQVRLQAPAMRDHQRLGMQASNYPNPFGSSTTLELSLPEVGEVQVRITDSRGRLVLQWPAQAYKAGVHRLELPAESWQDGAYHCEVLYSTPDRSERKVLRLLKQR